MSDELRISGSMFGLTENVLVSNGSQLRVSIFINNVRDAFVTSVTCSPPFGPPVKFYTQKNRLLSSIKCNVNALYKGASIYDILTQTNQLSMVPARHLRSLIAFFTLGTLTVNHWSFNAEKYGEIVKPDKCIRK